jgi:hypothetical protein
MSKSGNEGSKPLRKAWSPNETRTIGDALSDQVAQETGDVRYDRLEEIRFATSQHHARVSSESVRICKAFVERTPPIPTIEEVIAAIERVAVSRAAVNGANELSIARMEREP